MKFWVYKLRLRIKVLLSKLNGYIHKYRIVREFSIINKTAESLFDAHQKKTREDKIFSCSFLW